MTMPADDFLVGWLRECTASLCDAVEEAGLDSPCWTWWGAPATSGAVARHQAQEVAVHCWDAEAVMTSPEPWRRDVAHDGVAEFIPDRARVGRRRARRVWSRCGRPTREGAGRSPGTAGLVARAPVSAVAGRLR